MACTRSPYQVLGLLPDCTGEDIRRAYQRIQLTHHPDKTGNLPLDKRNDSEAISKAANVAYELLGDEASRQRYDRAHPPPATKPFSATASRHSRPAWPYDEAWYTPQPRESRFHETPPAREKSPPFPTLNDEYAEFFPSKQPTRKNTLDYKNARWNFTINISPRFHCVVLAQNHVWDDIDADRILIFAKIEQAANAYAPLSTKDVSLTVTLTPYGRRVTKIESYYKHRVTQDGTECILWITLFSNNTAEYMKNFWQFDWDVEIGRDAKPPIETPQYGTNLFFYDRVSSQETLPDKEFLKDRDMGPARSIKFVDIADEVSRVVTSGSVSMHRFAAFGYQSKPGADQNNDQKVPRDNARVTTKKYKKTGSASRRASGCYPYGMFVSSEESNRRWREKVAKSRAEREKNRQREYFN
ncbi:unnamed protein product [Periconia digitata]|uniref:J domain-containing protein n=1 Tax=Periconia digitata TaxID=1303443 RepID=A0A9W4UPL4_9PLEO|nr:unnamed protein product [Periconia digitata]